MAWICPLRSHSLHCWYFILGGHGIRFSLSDLPDKSPGGFWLRYVFTADRLKCLWKDWQVSLLFHCWKKINFIVVTTFEKQLLQHIKMIIFFVGIDVRARGAFFILIVKNMGVSVELMWEIISPQRKSSLNTYLYLYSQYLCYVYWLPQSKTFH